MSFALVYVTHADEKAAGQLTRQLLERRLIACANSFPISAAYWWQGAVADDSETVTLYKTSLARWEELRTLIGELHPYDTPCIMKMEVEANAAYEQWIEDCVTRTPQSPDQ